VLEHPDVAIVEINPLGDQIRYLVMPGAPSDYVNSALLNQTLPRVLSLRGSLVLHASAVSLERQMVILAGRSEAGKSTLAKSLAGLGSEILSDDCVLLTIDEMGVVVGIPSYPGIDSEMNPVSMDILRPTPVNALFELRGLPAGEQRPPEVRPLSARDTTMLITRNMFVLDPSDKGRLESLFRLAGRVGSRIAAFDLLFPWGQAYIPTTGKLIVQSVAEAASSGAVGMEIAE
jgi:energy-coupling factor transporter ATP-binding protein EcfA2